MLSPFMSQTIISRLSPEHPDTAYTTPGILKPVRQLCLLSAGIMQRCSWRRTEQGGTTGNTSSFPPGDRNPEG